jgi:mersacidin/lichenicidin family type 2 lantibiotic
MSTEQIIRAWKDVRYRQSLSEEEQALVPTHPAGAIELAASELADIDEEMGQCVNDTRQASGCIVPPALF